MTMNQDIDARIREVLPEIFGEKMELVNGNSQPNINRIWQILRQMEIMQLNLKFFGYDIAKRLANEFPAKEGLKPYKVGLSCKPTTQHDIEQDWTAYWCKELRIARIFHRKVWELAYVLQAMWENDCIKLGKRGLGFGCGVEALPSYLASKGVDITVTDLPPEHSNMLGWSNTNQYTVSLEHAYHPNLVDRASFEKHVSLEFVDMNKIPETLRDYDFCWSICALEHVGSIEKGLNFIENSLNPLRSGGFSIHTTEFNYSNDEQTIDNWNTVLFQRKHFREIHDRLTAKGHHVMPLDFTLGSKVLDQFIDVPPFAHDMTPHNRDHWGQDNLHLHVSVDGFPATCFGMIIQKT
jgi:hypothetical protein